ncbi:Mce protein [Mycolicibacterium thermoresistibile]
MAEHADAPDTELNDAATGSGDGDADTESDTSVIATDAGDPNDDAGSEADDAVNDEPKSTTRAALAVGMAAVVALAGVGGWLGYRAYDAYQAKQERDLFLDVGRQTALNLTNIDHTRAEADVQRILDLATGAFHDDFQRRSPSFIEVVRNAQAKSEGTITEVALESLTGDEGLVLVAANVDTSNAAAEEQEVRAWRMRLTVQKTDDTAKVSNVEFVP